MHYLDTSAIIAVLINEPARDRLRATLHTVERDGFAASFWTDTEVASALSLKVRTDDLSLEERSAVRAEWRRWRSGMHILAVAEHHFASAADFAEHAALSLRGGDALHLAIARAADCRLITLDKNMARAAPEVGVSVTHILPT